MRRQNRRFNKRLGRLFILMLLLAQLVLFEHMTRPVRAAAFTPGNVVVYRVGDGSGSLVNTGNAVFLDEYTPAGTLVQSIALPTADTAGQKAFVASGTATSEGLLTRSADGRYLVATGYNRAPGGATSITGTTSAAVNRLVARVDASGAVDTSTALTDAAEGNNIRSVASTNGADLWVTGGAGGVRATTLGATTSTQLSTTVTNLRQAQIFDGQLYVSTSSGSAVRIGAVGTGTPTTSGQTITNLPGLPTTGSPYGFFLADLDAGVAGLDTLYVADDTSTAGVGGIKKYSLVGGSWTSNGTAGTAADAYRGLTGVVSGGTVTLYATRKGGSTATGGGELVALADSSGYNGALSGTPTLLASAAANTAFRGVALTPAPAGDSAPAVASTIPAGGATDVALDAGVEVTFSEAVAVADGWYALGCTTSGTHTADVTGGPLSYTLDISGTLASDETCTVTIDNELVLDQDGTPTAMAQDYSWSFSTVSALDAAPTVVSTTPSSGATSVSVASNLTIEFSEPVTVTGSWYGMSCTTSGAHSAAVSGGPTTYTLNPDGNFSLNESCTVTIDDELVADQDGNDPPDTLAQDYSWSFATTSLTITPIGTVQGAVGDGDNGRTHRSSYAPASGNSSGSTSVTIQGVIYELVLARNSNGSSSYSFFIQNTAASADGDPTTSDGIVVFTGSSRTIAVSGGGSYTPVVGDEIVLSGRVGEFFFQTQLSGSLQIHMVLRSGVNLDAELPPFVAAPPDELAPADRYWERREGMRGAVARGSVTMGARAEFASTMDAEVWTIPPAHPVAQRANPYERLVFRDPHPLDNNTAQLFDDGNNYRVLLGSLGVKGALDDSTAMISSPDRPHATTSVTATGGVYFSFEKYSIQVDAQPSYANGADPSLNSPPQTPRWPREYSVASYNVENLYDYRDDPFDGCDFTGNAGCAGVNPPFNYVPASAADYQARLNAQADQIIQNLRGPDIIMVQEAEDQDICQVVNNALSCGAANNADGKPDTIQELALTILAHGGPRYDAAFDRNGADARGIVTAFLYRADRVQLIAPAASHPVLGGSPTVSYRGTPLSYNTDVQNPKALNADLPDDVDTSTGVDGANVFTRAPLVGYFRVWRTFVGTGDALDLYVINNHFSSTPDARVGQRSEQASYLAAIIAAIQDAQPLAKLLAGGDFNVFPRPDDPFAPGHPLYPSDQLGGLYDQGLANLWAEIAAEAPSNAYSYIFAGQAQTLDSMFVSAPLSVTLVEARVALINAGWKPMHSGVTARGWSDHNPTVARFTIAGAPRLSARATYNTGLGDQGAEIVDVRGDVGLLTNAGDGSVDILDIGDLLAITRVRRLDLPAGLNRVNSVAVHPNADYFLLASGSAGQTGAVGAFHFDGTLIVSATVGIQPDSVDISPDGRYAVVANEAEAVGVGNHGGAGSLSVIDLRAFDPATSTSLSVTNLALESQSGTPGFSTGRADDIGRIAISNEPETMEPESIAFSPNSRYAYVTLQENNGVVRVELDATGVYTETYWGLGMATHLADLTTSGGYNPVEQLALYREPDGIAVTPDGLYVVTADEGDTRLPSGGAPRGGRTVSIFDAQTGALVADTGSQLDDMANAYGVYPDSRSNRGGSEPEVLDVAAFAGRTIVAVGLERASAVALVDITVPAQPVVFELIPTGANPEGVKLVVRDGALYVLTANEVGGTITSAIVPVGAFHLVEREDADGGAFPLHDIMILDLDAGEVVTVTIALDEPLGALSTGSSGSASSTFDAVSGVYTATGALADVNALLAALVFTPGPSLTHNLEATISVTDSQGNVTSGTLLFVVDDAPAAADDSFTTPEDTTLVVTSTGLLANDGDPEGAGLRVELVEDVLTGTLDLHADGTLVYTPALNFSGALTFTYRVGDGVMLSAPATVTITVTPVNDAPTLSSIGVLSGALPHRPFTVTYELLASLADEADVDGAPVLFRITSVAANGTLTKNGAAVQRGLTTLGPGEALVFTPARGGTLLEAFGVVAYDGQAASSPPVAVLVSTRFAHYLPLIVRAA